MTKRVWRAAVVLGQIEGYRPSPSVDDVRAMIEAHESVTVGEAWPYYLDWAIRQVDDGYAAGLAQGLGKAEARWMKANSGDESLADRITLMRLTRDEVSALQRLGEWFGRGGCEVRWHRDGDVDLFREAAA